MRVATQLIDALQALRAAPDAASLEHARALLHTAAELPEDLRGELDSDEDPALVADALLGILGAESDLSALFTAAFAEEVEAPSEPSAAEIARALDLPFPLPLADALLDEAGEIGEIAGPWLSPLPLADALLDEAGEIGEIAGPWLSPLPLADALLDEAGEISIAEAVHTALSVQGAAADLSDALAGPWWVSALLDRALPLPQHRAAALRLSHDPDATLALNALAELSAGVRGAVRDEAGVVALGDAISASLALTGPEEAASPALREALLGEAGEVQVADAVLQRVRRGAVAPTPKTPRGANRSLWGALLVAAAMLFTYVFAELPREGDVTELEPVPMQFADAREITVDELSWAQDAMVQVIQASDEGDEQGALIIWVEEGVVL